MCSFVPHHHGEEHADAAAMEISDHLAYTVDTAGHGFDHLQLIAIIDSHVRVGGPNQHSIDAAVAFVQVVEITVDRVAAGDRVVDIAIVDHHLRLYETGLRPLKRRHLVARGIVG